MNWKVIIIFGIAAIALLVFIIARNMKDKKELEDKIKQDYRKPKAEESDIELDDPKI